MPCGPRPFRAGMILSLLGILAACSPISNLPSGPTAIPTLAPATDIARGIESTPTAAFTIMSFPAQEPRASAGQEIYAQECIDCHGKDGTGEMPSARNFRDLDYVRGETPANFYIAVTEGRGSMPAYQDRLSSDERWDVVFFVWRLSTSTERLQEGRQIYDDHCAACHGENGGGELLGSADFTDLRQMANLAPRDLYLTVTQGRGSMPAWQARLDQDSRWAVIDYLRTFSYDPRLADGESTETAPEPTEEAAQACDPNRTNPFDWGDSSAVEAGRSIYAERCAACHGADGMGGLPDTPDFTSPVENALLMEESGTAFCTIQDGDGPMPGFGDEFSPETIWQVLTYLESLAP